jgi:hypothetical protein
LIAQAKAVRLHLRRVPAAPRAVFGAGDPVAEGLMSQPSGMTACIGLRAKTARAIAVVLAGTAAMPRAVVRTEIALASPADPALFQPYHEVMDLPWERAIAAVQNAERAIEAAASKELQLLIEQLRSRGIDVSCVGIVGAPERNLAAIGSPHIRAHAAEGVLFRHALQVGAQANDLPSAIHSERGIEASAVASLGVSLDDMRARLAEIGRVVGSPWRADEKAAAMAAWIGLAGVRRPVAKVGYQKKEL